MAAVWIPALVWAAAAGVFLTTCAVWGRSPFELSTWIHGDPVHYIVMARRGFTLFRCPGYYSFKWCGDAGWFPGYPWLTRLLATPGLDATGVAVALSWAFTLATLVLLWVAFLDRRVSWTSLAVLVYAAFAPGQVYGYAAYPLSMLIFFTLLYICLLDRRRWLAAGLAGVGVVLAYPVGVATPAMAALFLLVVQRRVPVRERLRRIALAVGPAVAAIGLYLVALQVSVGHWNAYFLVQAYYEHKLRTPLGTTYDALKTLFRPDPFAVSNFVSFNEILVTAALVCVLLDRAIRRRDRTETDVLLVLCLVATWVIPVSTSHQTYSRGEAALLPIAVLIGKLKPPLAIGFAVAAVLLAVPMEVSFLHEFLN